MPAPRAWTPEAMIAAIAGFLRQYHRPPRRQDFRRAMGLPDIRLVERQFRSWQDPIRLALAAVSLHEEA